MENETVNPDAPLGLDEVLGKLPRREGPRNGDVDNFHADWRRSGLKAEQDENGLKLHRFVDTAVVGHKNEQPWHRMAAYMLLCGRTNSEIGMAAGVAPVSVSQLRAQRWFQELLAVLANEQGDAMRGLVQSEAMASFQKMVEIRDDTNAPLRLRYTAAKDIFEQSAGKAVQKVISIQGHTSLSPKDEEEMLREELANLAKNVPAVKSLLDQPTQ